MGLPHMPHGSPLLASQRLTALRLAPLPYLGFPTSSSVHGASMVREALGDAVVLVGTHDRPHAAPSRHGHPARPQHGPAHRRVAAQGRADHVVDRHHGILPPGA